MSQRWWKWRVIRLVRKKGSYTRGWVSPLREITVPTFEEDRIHFIDLCKFLYLSFRMEPPPPLDGHPILSALDSCVPPFFRFCWLCWPCDLVLHRLFKSTMCSRTGISFLSYSWRLCYWPDLCALKTSSYYSCHTKSSLHVVNAVQIWRWNKIFLVENLKRPYSGRLRFGNAKLFYP